LLLPASLLLLLLLQGGDGVRIRCQCGSAQCRNRLI
jgi:hypothetical protein